MAVEFEGRGDGCAPMKPRTGKCHDSRPAGKLPLVRVSLARDRCDIILPMVRRRAAKSEHILNRRSTYRTINIKFWYYY